MFTAALIGALAGALAAPAAAQTAPPRNLKVVAAPATATQGARVALVIGNERYRDAPLSNPANDARAMARALQDAGFEVLLRTDADQREMLAVLREFGNRLRGSQAGVFYYAGHGMQIKGRNYLIPVGADIQREDEVAYQSLDAQAVLDKMETAGNGANLMILDACRNNPFARSFRSSVQGLAQMEAPVGTLVAFATSPGAVASDGQGQHGLYTQHLLEAMKKPGLKVEDVFKQVRAAVRRASQGRQVPWESTSLEGDFYLSAPPQAPAPAPVVALPPPPAPGPAPVLAAEPASGLVPASIAQMQAIPTPERLALAAPLAPAPAAQPAPADPLPGAAAAVDRDRRTQELLAELAPVRRPAGPPNAHGFVVGDQWRYRVADKLRGNSIVSVYQRRVEKLQPDGGWQSGTHQFTAAGDFAFRSTADGKEWERWSPPLALLDPAPVPGTRRPLAAVRERRDEQGRISTTRFEGELVVRGTESVDTPAGRFDALKIEVELKGEWRRDDGARSYQTWWQTHWYAPALGLVVASDFNHRSGGTIDLMARHELVAVDTARSRAASTLAAQQR